MATGYSSVSDLNGLFNNIFEDAVFVAREQSLLTRLVKTFTDGRGDQVRYLGQYPEVTADTVAELEDYSNPTVFSKTPIASLTPEEAIAQAILTDRRIETDTQDARQDCALELGAAIAAKFETDLAGDFGSLTGGTVGAAGSTMIWGYFFAALSRLRANNVPQPWYCVLHPYQYHALAKSAAVAATMTNAPAFQDAVMQQWYVGTIAGVNVFTTSHIAAGTAAVGAMFNPNALAFDLRRDLRLEPERDASKRAWELNMTAVYAHGVWRSNWGIKIIADASAPTS